MENNIISDLNSYLTFQLDNEYFAINVGNVSKIEEMTSITRIPKAPAFIKGVFNLNGRVIPVIDTRLKFGMNPKSDTTNTCILVVSAQIQDEAINLGMIVDSVSHVIEVNDSEIMPPPGIGSKYTSEYIRGVFNFHDNFVMIINMDILLSNVELLPQQKVAIE